MSVDRIFQKTIQYLSVPAVVGHEWAFMRHLEDDFLKLGVDVTLHEGLLEIKGKAPSSHILSVHADRHGLISLGNGEYAYAAQYVKEIKYGENNESSQEILQAISRRFQDEEVFAYDPQTGDVLARGIIDSCLPCMANGDSVFWIRDMESQPVNTPIAYARDAKIDGPYFKGQIDNALCLGALYCLFEDGYSGTALITTEEEIGYSWLHISHWLDKHKIETQSLFVLDTSPFKDTEPVTDGQIILRSRDKSACYNPLLMETLASRCENLLLPYQIKDKKMSAAGVPEKGLGSTELGKLIMRTDQRWSGATIQIPTLEYHTSYETTGRNTVENYYSLLRSLFISDLV